MLESIRGIEKAIAGKTFRDYERSWLLRSAIERGIEVISEASVSTPLLFGRLSRMICLRSRKPCSL
jgi:uncharacterized protein with HEPN domain